jgi:hypothetical protein
MENKTNGVSNKKSIEIKLNKFDFYLSKTFVKESDGKSKILK